MRNERPYLYFWAPWYVIHKLLAGFLDTYLYYENRKALEIARKLADWIDETLKNVESLAELYARTEEECLSKPGKTLLS